MRYKLQKRVRRLKSSEPRLFCSVLGQFWDFLKANPVFWGVLKDLRHRNTECEKTAIDLVDNKKRLFFDTETENIAVSYFILKKCVEDRKEYPIGIVKTYFPRKNAIESIESFCDMFVEPLYEYIDEQIDDQRAMLNLLGRYKHKCEWFNKRNLYDLWNGETQRGERLLKENLFEYLHDQGVDFTIEEESASGKPDLTARLGNNDYIIVEVKIFDPGKSKDKNYIIKGFNQLYRYTKDFNEPFGYYIIFNSSKENLSFSLPLQKQVMPFIIHDNKTIFIITIDIYSERKKASKEGALKTTEIKENDLIQVIEKEIQ